MPESKPTKNDKALIGGFMNVAWGTSREEAMKIISLRDGVVFDAKESNQNDIYFNGGTFSDFQVHVISLSFVHDRFYSGLVVVKPKPAVQDTWIDLCTGLTKKYGPEGWSDGVDAIWKFPYDHNANE